MAFNITEMQSQVFPTSLQTTIVYLPESCSSTMDIARDKLKTTLFPALVISEKQTKGRGSYNRVWNSTTTGNLYFTLALLSPPLSAQLSLSKWLRPIRLSVGVAMCIAIQGLSFSSVSLKWPNDLLINGKKVGGILLEVFPLDSNRWGCGIGIGINVNCQTSDFSHDLPSTALPPVSLKEISHTTIQRETLLAHFLNSFSELLRPFAIYVNASDDLSTSQQQNCEKEHELLQNLLKLYSTYSCVLGRTVSVHPKSLFLSFLVSFIIFFSFLTLSLKINVEMMQQAHITPSLFGLRTTVNW